VTADILQVEHDVGKFIDGYRTAGGHVADLVILAVTASQVAGGKKDGSRPSFPGKGRLLAVVRQNGAYEHFPGEVAESSFTGNSVYPAHPRAEFTIVKDDFQLFQLVPDIVIIHYSAVMIF
jgi:hypothetical protein